MKQIFEIIEKSAKQISPSDIKLQKMPESSNSKSSFHPQNIDLIKPSIDSFLKSMKKGPSDGKDMKGQFNILLNLVKGQIAKQKGKVTMKMEDITIHAFKYMLDNNLLNCKALQAGFETGAIYDFPSYQAYFELRPTNNDFVAPPMIKAKKVPKIDNV